MKVATFNANSIRMRLGIITDWLAANSPDVLAIQETKAQDRDFPAAAFREVGYHVVFCGEKSYNGVAIISKERPGEVSFGLDDPGPRDEARLAVAKIGKVNVVNTYVPQGTAVDSVRFQYKLLWFARLKSLFESRFAPEEMVLWMGDLNVAPTDRDVYDPKRLAGGVCFHPDEHRALSSVVEWGFVDVFRKHCDEEGLFSFFDYRIPNALKRNLGWRLDHIFATKPLAAKSTAAWIDLEPRRAPKPSDHTFVVAEFDI